MKMLIISDLHYIDYIDLKFLLNLEKNKFDIVLCLGDIDQLYYTKISKHFKGKPIFGVLGNHDYDNDLNFANIENLHGKIKNINNINILGLEGCVNYKKEHAIMHSQEDIITLMDSMEKSDILISHNSPYQIHEKFDDIAHKGYIGLLNYINKHSPKLVLHGHQHKWNISKLTNNTTIICVYGACIIDSETLNQEIVVDLSKWG